MRASSTCEEILHPRKEFLLFRFIRLFRFPRAFVQVQAESSSWATSIAPRFVRLASPSKRQFVSIAVTVLLGLGAVITAHPKPAAAAAPNSTGFVGRSGTSLMLNGAPYQFTGLNIYNANSINDYWYTMGSGSALDQALTAAGPGKNVFRAWFGQWLARPTGAGIDWSAFDHTLAVARAHNYRVVVTLADQDGTWDDGISKTLDSGWYQGGYATAVGSSTSSWGARNTLTYKAFVKQIVSRYRNDPTVLMWQLVNEAETKRANGTCSEADSDAGAAALRGFSDDMGSTIKNIDPNHLVSLGTIGTGQCGTSGDRFKQVYASPGLDVTEMHDYVANQDIIGDQWNGMALRLQQSRELNKPMFVGEMGIDSSEVGGLQARADRVKAKLTAQLAAGVVGVLAWEWRNAGQSGGDRYVVSPGDPMLASLDLSPPAVVPAPAVGGWALAGTARVSSTTLSLTDAATSNRAGCAFWPTAIPSDHISASFDATLGGGSGADGMTFLLADPSTVTTSCGSAGGGLGWSGISGVAVALDTFRNGADPSANFVGIATGHQSLMPDNLNWASTSIGTPPLRNVTRHVEIYLNNGSLNVSVDGEPAVMADVTVPRTVLVGFTAGNGGLTDGHSVTDVKILVTKS